VAFASSASNLVSGDTNNHPDIFVHDRQTGVTTRVSVASDGTQTYVFSFDPSISADGRYVAFGSEADNLVSGDTNGRFDIFVREMNKAVVFLPLIVR
jgi:Tol biopolymer transport system component